MGTPFCKTAVNGRLGVLLFRELVSIQNMQRFSLLSFAVEKFCHIIVHCNGANCVTIYLCVL